MTPVFDIAGSMDRVDGDRELLLELVDMATQDASGKILIMEKALAESDGKILSEVAHSIKSAFGNVGAMQCHALSYELEKAGKNANFTGVNDLLVRLKVGIAEFLAAVEEFRKSV